MNEISKYVNDWILRGNDDFEVIGILLKENAVPNMICFHAQQAAEKYLKGFLAYHNKNVRKIHTITGLLQACVGVDESLKQLGEAATFLDQFYIETRYADDYVEFNRTDAKKAFEAATLIKEFVLKRINT